MHWGRPYEPFAALGTSQYIRNNAQSCKPFLDTLHTQVLVRTMIPLAICGILQRTGLTGAAYFSSGMLC